MSKSRIKYNENAKENEFLIKKRIELNVNEIQF